jgi:hypothetical protein
MDRDELKEKLAKQLYEWIDDDGWEWREITETSRDVYRVKAAAILSLLAPILADAEKWRKVKEIAKTTDCYPICPFVDFCANSDIPCCFGVIVDALDGEEEKEDAS